MGYLDFQHKVANLITQLNRKFSRLMKQDHDYATQLLVKGCEIVKISTDSEYVQFCNRQNFLKNVETIIIPSFSYL